MQVNIRLNGIVLAAAVGLGAWLVFDHLAPHRGTSSTSIATPEVPVVMRTTGGLLEIATVTAYERFSRADTREFWGIDLGTTVSQVQARVTYRYHVAMAREWPLAISGTTCIVRAGEVRPSLPVAFDSGTLQKYSRNGWARFNKDDNLQALEQSMTSDLRVRAGSPGYLDLAREAGRRTIAEFVATWLLKERGWTRDPQHKVIVLFPGESMPAPGAKVDP